MWPSTRPNRKRPATRSKRAQHPARRGRRPARERMTPCGLRRPGAPTSIAPVAGNQELQPQLVDEPAGVARMCARAAGAGVVALDTESDSLHSYFHKLCLIQLSFAGEHVVLDPLALDRESLSPFAELLADAGVVKVLHGADYDLRVLHRDLGARVVRLRDTQVAAQLLGEAQTGLAALVEREAGIALDKRHQRADWGKRPLTSELLAYAAGGHRVPGDAAWPARRAPRRLGRLPWWEEECLALEAVRWEPPRARPDRLRAHQRRAQAVWRGAGPPGCAPRVAGAGGRLPRTFRRSASCTRRPCSRWPQSPPADLAALASVPGVGKRPPPGSTAAS